MTKSELSVIVNALRVASRQYEVTIHILPMTSPARIRLCHEVQAIATLLPTVAKELYASRGAGSKRVPVR